MFLALAAAQGPARAASDAGSARARSLAAHVAAREWAAGLGLSGDAAVPLASPLRLGPAPLPPDSLVARTLRLRRDGEAAFSAKDWTTAAASYRQLTQLNPYDADAWDLMSLALHHGGDYRAAIAGFERAAESGAGFPFDPPYNIACCYARLGDKASAMRWLERSFALGYRYIEDLRKDEDLASLREDAHFKELAGVCDVSTLSRVEGWRFDLALLDRELRRIHFDPYRVTPRESLDRMVRDLRRHIPHLTDEQVAVEMMKMVASIGDAHTRVGPAWGLEDARKVLPVSLSWFVEGLFIIAADSAHAGLTGLQVIEFDGHPVHEVLPALAQVIPRDNDLWLRAQGPRWMAHPRVLNGLGIAAQPDRVTLTLVDANGAKQKATLVADSTGPADAWESARSAPLEACPPSVRLAGKKYAFELLPGTQTLYVAYNTLIEDPKDPLEGFFGRMFACADSAGVDRLIVDVRRNAGGNNFLNRPLWQGIVARPHLNQHGRVFVLTGRVTFSAAICSALQLSRHTNVVLIGEPTSSPPNFTGETIVVNLPYSRMRATISDLFWQNGVANDYRAWLAPDVYVAPTMADFRAGTDPALAAAVAWPRD